MRGYRLLALLLVLVSLGSAACGMLPGSQPAPTPAPQAPAAPPPAAAASPAVTKPAGGGSPAAAASPSPAAKPGATSAAAPAAAVDRVWVGNTDGEGVYLRKTPVMADRIKAYPDKTVLVIIDADTDGDGQRWHKVRAPDGVEGYVPVQYTVTTEP